MQKRPTWKYPKDFWQRYKSNAVEESYIFQQTVQEQLDIHGGKIFLVAGKESSCNAGDPSLSPGSGKSPGKEIGYPLQYSWAFLVAQMIKNPLAIRETWVRSLGQEVGMATHSSILTWRIPMDRDPGGLQSMGSQKVGHDWATKYSIAQGKSINFDLSLTSFLKVIQNGSHN